jgi:UDP-N-acetylmuramoyl-L-alanyl-D-glutamate--2,6-diaminopimelate ligase
MGPDDLPPASLDAIHQATRTACVTGTNGKTSTTSMIEAIVAASGEPTARVTTLGAWVNGIQVAEEATGEAFALAVRAAHRAGVRTLAIETTSQALAEGFAREWPADVGVFTNLSRDHLDYHGTPEHYLAAKAQLFMNLRPGGAAVLNAADPSSALLGEILPPGVRLLAYAARPVAPESVGLPLVLAAERVEARRDGTLITLVPSPLAEALSGSLRLRMVGEVQAENALGAALAARALGYEPAVIRRGIEGFAGVPGRFQMVWARPLVVVDFAHTPDALWRTLRLARQLVQPEGGRVICVFGCGGNRDAGKRPEMGRVASEESDLVIVTTDNPRNEDAATIAAEIVAGAGGGAEVVIEPDRAAAIARGISGARAYDAVVIAGKGHERVQIVGEQVTPFDDAGVARAICSTLLPRDNTMKIDREKFLAAALLLGAATSVGCSRDSQDSATADKSSVTPGTMAGNPVNVTPNTARPTATVIKLGAAAEGGVNPVREGGVAPTKEGIAPTKEGVIPTKPVPSTLRLPPKK